MKITILVLSLAFLGCGTHNGSPPQLLPKEITCFNTLGLLLILPSGTDKPKLNMPVIMPAGCRCLIQYKGEEYISSLALAKEKCNARVK